MANPPAKLLIFGDSWALSEDENMRTWPELLGERLGWSPVDSTNLQDEGRWTPIFFNTDAVPRDE